MVLKELIFTVSTVGRCDGLEVTDFFTVSTSGHSGAFLSPDFEQLIPREDVAVLTEWILTVSTLGQ